MVGGVNILWRAFREAGSVNGVAYHFHDPELMLVGFALKLRGKRVFYDVHEDVPRQILDKRWVTPWLRKLLAHLGPERILWGTDSTWYGSPQPLIDAFRAFTIPERMQAEFGYPPLTDAVKTRILGANAAALYGIEPPVANPLPADLAPSLLAAMDTARV